MNLTINKTTQNNTINNSRNSKKTKKNNPSQQNSKNENLASAMNRGQQANTDSYKIISFVVKTMKTLPNYRE